jgi:hypothetical protein
MGTFNTIGALARGAGERAAGAIASGRTAVEHAPIDRIKTGLADRSEAFLSGVHHEIDPAEVVHGEALVTPELADRILNVQAGGVADLTQEAGMAWERGPGSPLAPASAVADALKSARLPQPQVDLIAGLQRTDGYLPVPQARSLFPDQSDDDFAAFVAANAKDIPFVRDAASGGVVRAVAVDRLNHDGALDVARQVGQRAQVRAEVVGDAAAQVTRTLREKLVDRAHLTLGETGIPLADFTYSRNLRQMGNAAEKMDPLAGLEGVTTVPSAAYLSKTAPRNSQLPAVDRLRYIEAVGDRQHARDVAMRLQTEAVDKARRALPSTERLAPGSVAPVEVQADVVSHSAKEQAQLQRYRELAEGESSTGLRTAVKTGLAVGATGALTAVYGIARAQDK